MVQGEFASIRARATTLYSEAEDNQQAELETANPEQISAGTMPTLPEAVPENGENASSLSSDGALDGHTTLSALEVDNVVQFNRAESVSEDSSGLSSPVSLMTSPEP
jgi:hypothetical protein